MKKLILFFVLISSLVHAMNDDNASNKAKELISLLTEFEKQECQFRETVEYLEPRIQHYHTIQDRNAQNTYRSNMMDYMHLANPHEKILDTIESIAQLTASHASPFRNHWNALQQRFLDILNNSELALTAKVERQACQLEARVKFLENELQKHKTIQDSHEKDIHTIDMINYIDCMNPNEAAFNQTVEALAKYTDISPYQTRWNDLQQRFQVILKEF